LCNASWLKRFSLSVLCRSSRLLVFAALMGLFACTASWNSLVRYSDQPAPSDQRLETGVYVAVLRGYDDPRMPSITVLTPPESTVGPLLGYVTAGRLKVPSHWADTLREAVNAALTDSSMMQSAPTGEILSAAQLAGLKLVLAQDFHLPIVGANGRPNAARLWLSRPGFNSDSTIATIRTRYWCGGRCGHEMTFMLARRPGYQWRIWTSRLHWVS
jgi:hypothetical protein